MTAPITSALVALKRALGLDLAASITEVKAKLREALGRRDYASFGLYTETYRFAVPMISAVELQQRFTGTMRILPGSGELEPYEIGGFLRRAYTPSGIYHPDSVDFEDRQQALLEQASGFSDALIETGVNVPQALGVRLMADEAQVILCGSVWDFYVLNRSVGRLRETAHPASRMVALETWGSIAAAYPALEEVFREVAP